MCQQKPASVATGKARPFHEGGGEAVQPLLRQVSDFVRAQPLGSMSVFLAAGLLAGKLLSRR